MKADDIKLTFFKKGFKSIPNVIWTICASYALFMLTNLFVLNFAHIDADKHINRYFDIILSQQEAQTQPSNELKMVLIKFNARLIELEKLTHPPAHQKKDDM